jgi:predicted secreted hydrolase
MRSRLGALAALMLLATAAAVSQQAPSPYKDAQPGYRYSFPRDHFNHPDFKTEWWYYTGNVRTADGHAFGFQVTFFRQGVQRQAAQDSPWAVEDLYLAHAALSDLSGGRFYHTERLNRAGPGIAGVSQESGRIWNGNWQTVWTGDRQTLDAVTDGWRLHFTLDPEKPPVINGEQGISRKGGASGEASHYISMTRLAAGGTIEIAGQAYTVEGTAWMDHEFFTNQLAPEQVGWDWLSLQLGDRTELMLFRLRRKDGSIDPLSAGTYVEHDGRSRHLASSEFVLRPSGRQWTSPATGASYPVGWRVEVPSLRLSLEVSTRLAEQEMTGSGRISPNYWEGAIEVNGTRGDLPLKGVGYLEMTGYDKAVRFGE